MENQNLTDFGYILLFIIGSLAFIVFGLLATSLIRPKRPNEEKLSIYECGEESRGTAWASFNIRFYVIALIFILFDVELVFLFPWATVFGQQKYIEETEGLWGWFALTEMFIFIGVLVLGLVYAWRFGYLDWLKHSPKMPPTTQKPSNALYEVVNKRYQKTSTNSII